MNDFWAREVRRLVSESRTSDRCFQSGIAVTGIHIDAPPALHAMSGQRARCSIE
jgi:hypothetical protein